MGIWQLSVRQMEPMDVIGIHAETPARIYNLPLARANYCFGTLSKTAAHRFTVREQNHTNWDTSKAFAFDQATAAESFVVWMRGNN